jgi:hypothetical protein
MQAATTSKRAARMAAIGQENLGSDGYTKGVVHKTENGPEFKGRGDAWSELLIAKSEP